VVLLANSVNYPQERSIILLHVLTWLYILSAIALTILTAGIVVLLAIWFMHRHETSPLPPTTSWPSVTVQLPIYNESAVVHRLLSAAAALDYPRDRLRIQVLDDSDDKTIALVADLTAHYAKTGLNIVHIRRPVKTGYKAGALAYGMGLTDDEIIAVFDADFVPPPDFLRRTVPYFTANPKLGIVQTRWTHLNANETLITRSQAISIDGHFVVEQTARNRGHLLMSFNGTAGLWRAEAIRDAGGWAGDTLAEDLDLSYRAQIRGWRYLYLPDVTVPAELPPQVTAYKRQQARWAKGTTQNLFRLLPDVWRSPRLDTTQKIMATLHLCQYLPHPLLLILALLTPPLMWAGILQRLPLGWLGVVGVAAPLMYILSQRALYKDWPRRLIAFPILMAIGSGVIVNNTVAVLEAVVGHKSAFKRTPKFSGQPWQQSDYALSADWTTFFEALLAVYTFAAGVVALKRGPGLAPVLFAQSYGFGAIAFWSLSETLRVKRQRAWNLRERKAREELLNETPVRS
jgi:cellulose synthase/poly-beta-1,6-N-acetylglucosamine synthase-like glycosyltransferase